MTDINDYFPDGQSPIPRGRYREHIEDEFNLGVMEFDGVEVDCEKPVEDMTLYEKFECTDYQCRNAYEKMYAGLVKMLESDFFYPNPEQIETYVENNFRDGILDYDEDFRNHLKTTRAATYGGSISNDKQHLAAKLWGLYLIGRDP